ncbi:TetR/AcrR family transcriptional regulator [Geodermatophilus marinus]|uniref:TetR/AcrR family transcriptional regulator n=1 Tax=Geodermatophilus sp. LHW52908 TaxID=2303986 RepID=UPI000E3CB1C7|nr:TetR/AcrR family transcriptional regulator [Geodermatophilus sp. LHW52908]RFU19826.1 TetR/AcrR family transcriptional regulator [Geodermatophilus sp. LHW52908]
MRRSDQPYHHGALRAALLSRAAEQLRTGPVSELSLRRLARDLGVSHAAPSRHFPDRQALLDAVAEDGWRRLEEELAAVDPGTGAGLRARLLALGRAYVDFARTEPALLELMFAGKAARPHPPEAELTGPGAVVADAVATGEVAGADPARTGTVLWAALHGVAALAVGGVLPDGEVDAVLGETVDRLLDGLRPR